MKGKKCTLVVNTKNGYCFTPTSHNSINDAVKCGKSSFGFAYRIFDENNKLIKRGYCD